MRTGQTESATEDPIALRSRLLFWAFGWYLRWFFSLSFRGLRMSGDLPCVPADQPLIVYANHPSWWDPVLFMLLSCTILRGRAGFGPMEAKSLEKYRMFRRLGVYGIDSGTQRGAARFMAVSLRILSRPSTAVWVTSEGQFTDARMRPVRLRPGLAHLARRIPNLVIVPLAVEYTFWNERKPEALLRFGDPIHAGTGRDRSVAEWNALLEQRLTQTMDALASDAAKRDSALFRLVLKGVFGVGGLSEVRRRLAARAHLRHRQLAHDPREEPGA